jgi:hypothetical protein
MENKLFRVNNFKIVGKLVSADVKKGFDKSGKSYVSTNAVIQNEVDGKLNTFEVNFYSGEMTRDNKVSQLYTKYVSLPELINKKVEVTGELKENRYWSSNLGQIVGSQQLSGRFVNGVLDTVADVAEFEIGGFVVNELKEKVSKKDNSVYRYDVVIGQSNYNGDGMTAYTLHVNPTDVEIVRGVKSYEAGMTVKVKGKLSFIETVSVVEDENKGFGESMARTFVNKQKNFFITAGSNPIQDETRYDGATISALINAYKANDAQLMTVASSNTTSAPTTSTAPITQRQTSLI